MLIGVWAHSPVPKGEIAAVVAWRYCNDTTRAYLMSGYTPKNDLVA